MIDWHRCAGLCRTGWRRECRGCRALCWPTMVDARQCIGGASRSSLPVLGTTAWSSPLSDVGCRSTRSRARSARAIYTRSATCKKSSRANPTFRSADAVRGARCARRRPGGSPRSGNAEKGVRRPRFHRTASADRDGWPRRGTTSEVGPHGLRGPCGRRHRALGRARPESRAWTGPPIGMFFASHHPSSIPGRASPIRSPVGDVLSHLLYGRFAEFERERFSCALRGTTVLRTPTAFPRAAARPSLSNLHRTEAI